MNPYGCGINPYGYSPYGYGYGGMYGSPYYSQQMKQYTLTSSGYYKNGNHYIGHHQYSNATPQQYASYSVNHSKAMVVDPNSTKPISVPKASNRKTFTTSDVPQGQRGVNVKEMKLASTSKPWSPTVVSNHGMPTTTSKPVTKQLRNNAINVRYAKPNTTSVVNRNVTNSVSTNSNRSVNINRTTAPATNRSTSTLNQWRTNTRQTNQSSNVRTYDGNRTNSYNSSVRTGRQPARVSSPTPTRTYSNNRSSNFNSSSFNRSSGSRSNVSTPSRSYSTPSRGTSFSGGSSRSMGSSRPSSSGLRRGF